MVVTPDLHNLPYKEIKGVKYFELVASGETWDIEFFTNNPGI